MKKLEVSPSQKFTILNTERGIHALKMAGEGSLWMDDDELNELRDWLNSLEFPAKQDPSTVIE